MLNLKNKVVFKGDRTLWYVVIGLMLASLIVVYSSTGSLAFRVRGGNTSYYLIKQLFLMFGCMVVILTLQSFHYKYFLSFAKIVLGMSLIFLLWAKFAGTTLNDAGRWVTIPGIGFTFQPSEMAKLGIIMYCARAIAFEQTEKCCSNNVLWRMTLVVPVLFLIFMENFSTSGLSSNAVCRSFILENLREVDWGNCGIDDSDVGGCFCRSGKTFEVSGTFIDGEEPYRTFRESERDG